MVSGLSCECCCYSSAGDVSMTTDQLSGDEPFVPPPCMARPALTDGRGLGEMTRDSSDVVDEEIVISTAEDHDAEKAAEKMIERRVQV